MTIRVMLADVQVMVLEALCELLGSVPGFEVVAAVSDPAEIVRTALRLRPAVAMLDLSMAPFDGVTVAGQLARALPECSLALVSAEPDLPTVRRAIGVGVLGFLPKRAGLQQLIGMLRCVAAGQASIAPALGDALPGEECPLSRREREVLERAATGASSAAIAAELYLAPGTVRNVTSAAIKKLGARNRFDAVLVAREKGWMH